MDRLAELERRLTDFKVFEHIRTLLEWDSSVLLELLRMQLLEGKMGNGEGWSPKYSEDLKPSGYFNSPESAKRYADWKKTLTYPHDVSRDPDTPNLYITGEFHRQIGIEFEADHFAFVGTTGYANMIMARYGVQNFGLTDSTMAAYMNTSILPILKEEIKEYLLNGTNTN